MSAPSPSYGDDSGTDLSSRRQQLDYIREELLKYRPDIHDEELREAVSEWLIDASDVPTATAREYISSELTSLRRDNAMRIKPGVRSPEEAFPEECSDCEYYGSACPVLTDTTEVDRRNRIMDQTQDPDTLRYLLREYAVDNSCDVLLDRLEDLSQDYGPLLRRGQLLLMRVENIILHDDESEAVKRAIANEEALAGAVSREELDRLKNGHDGGDD
ncbi:hypothetical protein [Halorubrum sp. CSM-61]|uniref:hypothetical protein n=1 Tax=Halorubrum sp. CSM-61 TaxID=2485838 RepID=UPI000F4D0663|nr:hypothetical protein [Halorubrum sp. CSM-61]